MENWFGATPEQEREIERICRDWIEATDLCGRIEDDESDRRWAACLDRLADRFVGMVAEIKSAPGYTPEIGRDLGIEPGFLM